MEQGTQAATTQNTQQQTTLSYIDGYCERGGKPDMLAEPLNLVTNIAFIVGAILILKTLRFYKLLTVQNWDIILLTTILAIIGFGSGAYHAIPNALTVKLDVIPIEAFIFIYIAVFFIRVIEVPKFGAVLILIAFLAATIFFGKYVDPSTLNGTIMYVPTYLMMVIMFLVLGFVKQNPLYLHLINTAVIWTFSLAFRTMDTQICAYTHHIGTHFLWHLFNAIVLYRMLILVVIDKMAKQNINS